MGSRNSVEDLESGADVKVEAEFNPVAEFERIKENYRTTVIVPELPANYPETQAAFQELQNELHEFLGHHVPKVASLQAIISSNESNAVVHDNRVATRTSRLTRASMLIQNPDPDGLDHQETSLDSNQAQLNHEPVNPSRNSSTMHKKIPVNIHMQNLQAFLFAHMDNIVTLQNAMSAGTAMPNKGPNVSSTSTNLHDGRMHIEHGLAQRCHSLVVISTATAIFISTLLGLSNLILGPDHNHTGYDIAMMFAFLALSFHFGIIIIGGRGARHIAQHSTVNAGDKDKEDLNPVYITFYLTICEQLQLLGTLSLIIATFILSFFIFSSIGFSVAVLVLGAIWAIIVGASAYYKVLITVENVGFLMKNIWRLGWRSLDYVKTNVKTRPAATYP